MRVVEMAAVGVAPAKGPAALPAESCWRPWAHRPHETWGSSTGEPVYPIACPGVGPAMEDV